MTEYLIEGEIRTKRLLGKDESGKLVRKSALAEEIDFQFSDTVQVSIRPWPNASESMPRHAERRMIQATVLAEGLDDAESEAFAALEWLSDLIAFQLQQPCYWTATHAVGGGQGRVGNLRAMLTPKFQASVLHPPNTDVIPVTNIRQPPANFSEKSLGALRWYHKGVAALYDLDKFISFWVALELLAPESPSRPVAHMRPRNCSCGDFDVCPRCGVSTEYTPTGPGPQVTTFLVKEIGMMKKEALELAEFRQMLHGAGRLTPEHSCVAFSFAKKVQRAAAEGLRKRLGMEVSETSDVRLGPALSATLDPVTQLPLE